MVANPADAAAGFSHRSRSFQQRLGAIARRRRSRSRSKDEVEEEGGRQHAPPRSKSGSAIPNSPSPSSTMNTGTTPNSVPSRQIPSQQQEQLQQQQQAQHLFSSSESSMSADEMLMITGIDIRNEPLSPQPTVMRMQPGPSSYLISSSDDDDDKHIHGRRRGGGGLAILRRTGSSDGLKKTKKARADKDGESDDDSKMEEAASIPPVLASSSTDVVSNKDGSTSTGNNPESMDDLYEHDIDEAIKELRYLEETSRLPREREIPKIRWNDITLEEVLGYGGFSQVNRALVKSPLLHGKDSSSSNKKKATTTAEPEGQRYALKCLDDRLLQSKDRKKVIEAALDVAVEGDILARLNHPNIIQLHGVSTTNLITVRFTHKGMRDYFLLLDLLQETLLDRLQVWRRKIFLKSLVKRPLSKKRMLERIEVAAVGVARGMAYLHEKKVVLRDLKPENVGFDCNGTPKLFDFGFAREAHNVRSDEIAGSHCYMAPEMALGLGSDITADVYSFGVVLWELSSLQKPTEQFKMKKGFRRNRLNYSFRPSVTNIPSRALRKLIQECWSFRSADRPEFRHILHVLEMVIPMEVYDRAVSHDSISSETEELYSSAHFPDKVSNKEWGLDTISPSNPGLDLAARTVTSVPLDDSSIRKERKLMSGSNHSRKPMNGSNHSRKLLTESNHSRKPAKKKKEEEESVTGGSTMPYAATAATSSSQDEKVDSNDTNKKELQSSSQSDSPLSPLSPLPPPPPTTMMSLMMTPRKNNKTLPAEDDDDDDQKHGSARRRRSETIPTIASPRTPRSRGLNKKPRRTDSSTMDLKSPASAGTSKIDSSTLAAKPSADLSPTTGVTQKKKDAKSDVATEPPNVARKPDFPVDSFDNERPSVPNQEKSLSSASSDKKREGKKEEKKNVGIPAQILVSEHIEAHNIGFANTAWKSPLPAETNMSGRPDAAVEPSHVHLETTTMTKEIVSTSDLGITKQTITSPAQVEIVEKQGDDSSFPSSIIKKEISNELAGKSMGNASATGATDRQEASAKDENGDIPTQIEVVPSIGTRDHLKPSTGAAAIASTAEVVDDGELEASALPPRETLLGEKSHVPPNKTSTSYLPASLNQQSPTRTIPSDRTSLRRNLAEGANSMTASALKFTVDDLERQLDETTDEMVALQAQKNVLVSRIASSGFQQRRELESDLRDIETKLTKNAMRLIEIEGQMDDLGS